MDFVPEVLGQAQVVFVNAQGILVLAQNVQVPFVKFFGYLQMASSLDFFPGKSLPLHFWKSVMDILTHG